MYNYDFSVFYSSCASYYNAYIVGYDVNLNVIGQIVFPCDPNGYHNYFGDMKGLTSGYNLVAGYRDGTWQYVAYFNQLSSTMTYKLFLMWNN